MFFINVLDYVIEKKRVQVLNFMKLLYFSYDVWIHYDQSLIYLSTIRSNNLVYQYDDSMILKIIVK